MTEDHLFALFLDRVDEFKRIEMKTYQQIKAELGSGVKKGVKRFYVFANCPKIIFNDILTILKEKLGRGTQVIFISSSKESVKEVFLSSDFFSSKKIVVLDFEILSPSKTQLDEVVRIIDKLVGTGERSRSEIKNENDDFDSQLGISTEEKSGLREVGKLGTQKNSIPSKILIIRSDTKPIPKEIRDRANSCDAFYWVSWKPDDLISISMAKFPDVKFMADAEEVLKHIVSLGIDVSQIMEKAVIYAYPKRYIGQKDIINVVPPEISLKLKNFSLELLEGEIKSFPLIERSEDMNAVISAFTYYFLSFLKLCLAFSAQRSMKRYLIEKEMKTNQVDGIIKSIRTIKNPSQLVLSFSQSVEKSRVGKFPPSFYFFKFALDLRRKMRG